MRQRLIGAAHDPEAYVLVPTLHKCGNDGVKRTLVWGQRVGVFGIKHEQGAAVLEQKTHAAHRDPGTEIVINTLD